MEYEKRYRDFLRLRAESLTNNEEQKRVSKDNKFVVYPRVTNIDQLSDVINRLTFALAKGRRNGKVYVYVSKDLEHVKIKDLKVPQYQADYLQTLELFEFFSDSNNLNKYLQKYI